MDSYDGSSRHLRLVLIDVDKLTFFFFQLFFIAKTNIRSRHNRYRQAHFFFQFFFIAKTNIRSRGNRCKQAHICFSKLFFIAKTILDLGIIDVDKLTLQGSN